MLMARYPVGVAQAAYLDSKEPNLGGIYENVVAQQLAAQNRQLYYYQTKKRGEVDFVVDGPDGTAVPIEVKSGSYYHAHAALGHVLDTAEYGVRLGIVAAICDLGPFGCFGRLLRRRDKAGGQAGLGPVPDVAKG